MQAFFEKNFISTKNAEDISGYTSDYLARLARLGKISAKRIGHSWFIERDSLMVFLSQQETRKNEYARELARARGVEYRSHNLLPKRIARNVSSFAASVSSNHSLPSSGSNMSHIRAVAVAVMVVIASSGLAHIMSSDAFINTVSRAAAHTASFSHDMIESLFLEKRGVAVAYEDRLVNSRDEVRSTIWNATHVDGATLTDLDGTFTALLSAASISAVSAPHLAEEKRSRSETVKESGHFFEPVVGFMHQAIMTPSTVGYALQQVYVTIGSVVYETTESALVKYAKGLTVVGEHAFGGAVVARDVLAQAPQRVAKGMILLGGSIISASEAAIRADVYVAYWTARSAPQIAESVFWAIEGFGEKLATIAERAPAYSASTFLGIAAVPSHVAPVIAQYVVEEGYERAVRIVAVAHSISDAYITLVFRTGTLARELTTTAQKIALFAVPSSGSYMSANGVLAQHFDQQKGMLAAVLSALSFGEQVAVYTYQTGYALAASTGNLIASLFGSGSNVSIVSNSVPSVLPFATSTTGISSIKEEVSKEQVIGSIVPAAQLQTKSVRSAVAFAAAQQPIVNTYPVYTTVVNGVSEEVLNQSLVSMRTGILTSVAGMIQPVAAQTATNVATIQQVNMIQDLSNLIVRSGDFRGGTFSNATSISGTTATFSSLSVTGSGTTTMSGGITLSGGCLSVNGSCVTGGGSGTVGSGTIGQFPYYAAAGTTLTATSSLFLATSGNVGVGTTTPNWLLQVAGTRPSVTLSDTSAGTDLKHWLISSMGGSLYIGTSTDAYATSSPAALTVLNGGNIGIGTTSPGTLLSLGGTGANTVNISTTATSTFGSGVNVLTGCFAINGTCVGGGGGSGTVGSGTIGQFPYYAAAGTTLTATSSLFLSTAGSVGIGTSSPYSKLSVWGSGTGTGQLFSLVNNASTTVVQALDNGNVGIGTTSPGSLLSVAGAGYFAGNLNLDSFSSYKLAGQTVLSATSTTFNTLVGILSGNNILSTSTDATSGTYNTALGYEALRYATSTDQNTAVGYQALRMSSSGTANNAGTQNTAVGYTALAVDTSGNQNTAVGHNALSANTTGATNSAFGYRALFNSVTVSDNSAFGAAALQNTTAGYNSAFGSAAANGNSSGNSNASFGYQTAFFTTSGSHNAAFGAQSLYRNVTGANNTAAGYQALYYNNSATSSVAVGYQAAYGNSTFYNNQGGVYVGYQAGLLAGNNSDYNTFLGYQAGRSVTTGGYNIMIGQNVDAPTVTGSQQLNIGNLLFGTSLYNGASVSSTPVADGKLGIGTTSPYALFSISNNAGTTASTALFAIASTTAGTATSTLMAVLADGSVGIGTASPASKLDITNSATSTAIVTLRDPLGNSSLELRAGTSTLQNTVVGLTAGSKITTGGSNALFGYTAGNVLTTGFGNVLLGASAGVLVTTGSDNVLVGRAAGSIIASGAGNTLLGRSAGGNVTGSYNIAIGQYVGVPTGASSQQLSIGNVLFGTGLYNGSSVSGTPTADGKLGIGTTTPYALFSISNNTGTTVNTALFAIASTTAGTATSTLMSVLANGNVGIGTTSPQTYLTTVGTSGFNTGYGVVQQYIASNSTESGLYISNTSTGGRGYTIISAGTGSGLTAGTFAIGDAAAAAARLTINSSGSTGIGTTSPATLFEVGGSTNNVTFDGYQNCTGFTSNGNGLLACTASDQRLKQDIATLSGNNGLSAINALSPVSFYWKPETERGSAHQFGLVAQQVQSVFPNLVTVSNPTSLTPDGTLSVNYEGLISPMILAIQQLDARTHFIQSATTSAVLTVDISGNVGIGTTTPSHALTVVGDVAATAFVNTSTRTAKTDISYITETATEDMFKHLRDLKVATYHYNEESKENPLRLGLIAEDAQTSAPEVLSVDGKGVDLYKLATLTLSGVQTLATKLEAEHVRVTALEERVAALESGAVTSATGSPISLSTTSLASALNSFGVIIQKGIAQFDTLVARQFVASKDADGTSSAGSATILAGNTVALITNGLAKHSTKVFVTFSTPVNGNWWVSEKAEGSFRVSLSAPQTADVSFDYFLIQTESQGAGSSPAGSHPAPQSSGSNIPVPVIENSPSGVSGNIASTTTEVLTSGAPAENASTTSAVSTDTTAPIVTLSGEAAIQIHQGGVFSDPGATASDDVDGDITAKIITTGAVDTANAGLYTLTYSATDAAGNTGTASRVVTIVAQEEGNVNTVTSSTEQ